ncbi:hypothetical protein GUJ93_ZPchr0002g23515 [Zizania palustris]|uniref:Uncharacterized protein n=1 Tax=Zizania palustris TaxID=103762 RepID=A0A8J5RY60_ZIZPA|nr:hypothetical protein GUJ93_ZPchr0002g23515 [Zizania palustris]
MNGQLTSDSDTKPSYVYIKKDVEEDDAELEVEKKSSEEPKTPRRPRCHQSNTRRRHRKRDDDSGRSTGEGKLRRLVFLRQLALCKASWQHLLQSLSWMR